MTDLELMRAFDEEYLFVGRFLSEFISAPDREYGLSHEQWLILEAIEEHDRWLLADLADMLHVTRPAVSSKISVLVRMSLIEQQEDPEDRRKKFLKLTDKGRKILKKLRDIHAQRFQEWLAVLGREEAQRALLIVQKIEKELVPNDPWTNTQHLRNHE
ncbi:MarR family winged helix-turn-helix transcriptional regulator [Furfurilactobacillus curtus]|uniref:HTH marR-type domain-containing protein n=1 Tax=Furfurilactobacillus curtus TaxID=1746200 RepID=A0ABQ5JQH8_9LACO